MTSLTPSAAGTNIIGSSITAGNNNGTITLLDAASASSGYAGASGGNNAGASARSGPFNTAASTGSTYFEITLTPQNNSTITLTEISFGSRSTATGPPAYKLRTSADSFAADLATGTLVPESGWALKTNTILSFTFSSPTTFRIYGHGGKGANTVNWRIDDLTFRTSSAGGVDGIAPTVATLTPTDNAADVLVGTNLAITFSENVAAIGGAPGQIELRKTSDNSLIEAFPSGSSAVTGYNTNTIAINPSANLPHSTGLYITIPTGFLEDSAGNDFTGIGLATDWNFTTEAAPLAPSVVINKYLNTTTDLVELLVVGTGVAGENVDLRGMIIKDFTSNMNNDSGGKYTFTNHSLWSNVPVGTLIVLSDSSNSADISTSGFNLFVGLGDATYFTNDGGSFDISATDMIMIKSSSASPNGVIGGIHALAGGAAGTQFTSFTGTKLISPDNTGTGISALATNPTSTLADFSGSAATSSALAPSAFGAPNNVQNLIYINSLRGIIPGNGSGQASLTNATVGPFTGLTIFDDAQTDNQSVKIAVTAELPNVTLTTVEITVPTTMGVASGATVSGAGAGTPAIHFASQIVTISGLAITDTNPIEITLNGLDTPLTTSSDNGQQLFHIKTAIATGTPASIFSQPVAYVVIPIEAIRDVNGNGVPLDLNSMVAVEGVCTHSRVFNSNTLAYLQNANFGMAIIHPSPTNNPFIVGKHFAVLGTVSQHNGATQVSLTSFANVVDLGAGTNPAPLVITIPNLLLTPERYEGRLVTVENLSPAVWAAPQAPATFVTVPMVDAAANALAISITNASSATTGPGGFATITGIFSQNDSSSPFTLSYQLLPRWANDITPILSGYATWINSFFPSETNSLVIDFNADPDGDGIPNGIEALSGGNPNAPGVFSITELTQTGNEFTLLYPQDKTLPADLTAAYEWSTNMVNWQSGGSSFGGVTVTLADEISDDRSSEVNIYRVTATVTEGTASKLFIRVKAVKP